LREFSNPTLPQTDRNYGRVSSTPFATWNTPELEIF